MKMSLKIKKKSFMFIVFCLLELSKYFPSVLWHCWLGDKKGIRPVKSYVLVRWWWWFDSSFAWLIAPVITTTSSILSVNRHRLTQVHLEMAVKTDRERIKQVCIIVMNEWNSIELASIDRLPFRMRPVVENIVSTGTDAEVMDKYSSASLLSIGPPGVLLPEG